MVDRLAVMMGGRAAEDLIFGSATSGAENDLKQVIQLSRKMVLDWGMSDRFQNIAFGGQPEQMFLGEQISQRREYSEETAREVDGEIEKIIETAYRRAMEMLEKYRSELDKIAERLLEREEMPGDEVLDILGLDRAEAEPDQAVPAGSNGVGDVRGEQITEKEKG
jgi:cell division protease FtsH